PLHAATYLRIVSQMREHAAAAPVLEILSENRDERVVTECLRVLALLGDTTLIERLRKEFARPGVRPKRLLWALAMLGDQKAADDYLALVEGLVRIRPLVPPGGLTNPVPEVPSAATFAQVLQPDDAWGLPRI
ncbi:MAG: hypothetical protein L0170_01375, partial [Acidobacteria bacterium]|nr:hypothetical protein [Acidobacteriota bacterium]